MTSRSVAELKKLTKRLGLQVTQTSNRENKKDYVKVLQDYYLKEKYPEGVPSWLKVRLSMDSPMLCAQITGLKPEAAEQVWNSDDWVFEEKINGVRMMLFWDGQELHACSRNLSLQDYLPVDYVDKFAFAPELEQKLRAAGAPKFILDTEITFSNSNVRTYLYNVKGVETVTMLQAVAAVLALNTEDSLKIQVTEGHFVLNVFDILFFGKSLMNKPYSERYDYLMQFYSQYGVLFGDILSIPPRCTDSAQKKDFYSGILARGLS